MLLAKHAEVPQDACPQASVPAVQLYAVLAGSVEGNRDSLIACNAITSVLFVSADTALVPIRSRQARATNSPQTSVGDTCSIERDQIRHVYVDFSDTIVGISANNARALYTIPRDDFMTRS